MIRPDHQKHQREGNDSDEQSHFIAGDRILPDAGEMVDSLDNQVNENGLRRKQRQRVVAAELPEPPVPENHRRQAHRENPQERRRVVQRSRGVHAVAQIHVPAQNGPEIPVESHQKRHRVQIVADHFIENARPVHVIAGDHKHQGPHRHVHLPGQPPHGGEKLIDYIDLHAQPGDDHDAVEAHQRMGLSKHPEPQVEKHLGHKKPRQKPHLPDVEIPGLRVVEKPRKLIAPPRLEERRPVVRPQEADDKPHQADGKIRDHPLFYFHLQKMAEAVKFVRIERHSRQEKERLHDKTGNPVEPERVARQRVRKHGQKEDKAPGHVDLAVIFSHGSSGFHVHLQSKILHLL